MYFTFVCSAKLLIVVFLGHEDAVAAGVLHHDISPGNILSVGGWGILIDWDLSKQLKEPKSSADTYYTDGCQIKGSTDMPCMDDSQICRKGDTVRQPMQAVHTDAMQ